MKYIDADRLKEKLDEHYRKYQSKYMETRTSYTQGLIDALDLAEQVIDSLQEVEDYLNNLRPSWKPSEEQMEAFKDYIEDFQAKAEAAVGGWNNFDVMIQLYEQLKKL